MGCNVSPRAGGAYQRTREKPISIKLLGTDRRCAGRTLPLRIIMLYWKPEQQCFFVKHSITANAEGCRRGNWPSPFKTGFEVLIFPRRKDFKTFLVEKGHLEDGVSAANTLGLCLQPHACYRRLPTVLLPLSHRDCKKTATHEAIHVACCIYKRRGWQRMIGGSKEEGFAMLSSEIAHMMHEDLDWCKKRQERNLKNKQLD